MSVPVKISDESLKQLQDLQVRFEQLTFVNGDLHNKSRQLKIQINAVENEMDTLEAKRDELSARLQKEMGSSGTVNLETGEFTPEV